MGILGIVSYILTGMLSTTVLYCRYRAGEVAGRAGCPMHPAEPVAASDT